MKLQSKTVLNESNQWLSIILLLLLYASLLFKIWSLFFPLSGYCSVERSQIKSQVVIKVQLSQNITQNITWQIKSRVITEISHRNIIEHFANIRTRCWLVWSVLRTDVVSYLLTFDCICLDDKYVQVVCIEFWILSLLQSRS